MFDSLILSNVEKEIEMMKPSKANIKSKIKPIPNNKVPSKILK